MSSVVAPDSELLGWNRMSHLFISYSHLDRDYAHALAEALKNEFTVWIDDRIDFGETWPRVIQEKLDAAAAVIVIMTPRAYESRWVQNELARALRKEKPIFPLLLEGEPWLSVESTHYANVTGGRLPPADFRGRLRKALSCGSGSENIAALRRLGDILAESRLGDILAEKEPKVDARGRKVDQVLRALSRVLNHGERWSVGLHEVHSTTVKDLGIYLYAEVKDLDRLALYSPQAYKAYDRFRKDRRIKNERARIASTRQPDLSNAKTAMEWIRETSAPTENVWGDNAYLRNLGTELIWYPRSISEDLAPIAHELVDVNAKLGLPLELIGVSLR
ncbi:MAG: toll/interleukin-1 receptor domain-containing protein [Chthoniobacterales bacterium]